MKKPFTVLRAQPLFPRRDSGITTPLNKSLQKSTYLSPMSACKSFSVLYIVCLLPFPVSRNFQSLKLDNCSVRIAGGRSVGFGMGRPPVTIPATL